MRPKTKVSQTSLVVRTRVRGVCWVENEGTHEGSDKDGLGWYDGDGNGEAVTLSKGLKYN